MKKLIYLGAVLLMLMICLASCGKSKDPVPSGGTSNGSTQPTSSGGY